MKLVWKDHKLFIILCIIVSFFSGIGQTYLLALFNNDFEQALNISKTKLSFIYSIATFCASLFLPYIGRKIDEVNISKMLLIISSLLSLSLISLAFSFNIYTLFLGFLSVRLFGQSSLPLITNSALAKYFGRYRGKVLAISSIGRSIAEGSLPLIVLFVISTYSYKVALIGLSLLILVFLIPSIFSLLKDQKLDSPFYSEMEHVSKVRLSNVSIKSVYKDYRTYLLSITNVTIPFLMTAIFFHNRVLIEFGNWESLDWGKAFSVYAVFQILSGLLMGSLVDKFGSFRVISLKYFALMLAIISIRFFEHPNLCYIFLGLCGISVGMSSNSKASLLGEIFGDKILATIKSIDSTLMVISTSISPLLFSILFENFHILTVYSLMIGYLVVVLFLLNFTIYRYRRS